MEIFLDTASAEDIRKYADFIDGVTTNPSLVAKENRSIGDIVKDVIAIQRGPLSVEVMAETCSEMISEAHIYRKLSEHVVIKLPMTIDGLKACKELSYEGTPVNMTLCFSASQAIMAAKCNATYVSPFIGRLDDIGQTGLDLIQDIRDIYYNYFDTKILAASIRSVQSVIDVARLGVDVVTIPPKIMDMMFKHPLTDIGLEKFKRDASNA